MDRKLLNMLNVLSLLKQKPMTYDELWETSCFKTEKDLAHALHTLHYAGCIERIEAVKIWVILGYGHTFLSIYPTWTPNKVLDVVIPVSELVKEIE